MALVREIVTHLALPSSAPTSVPETDTARVPPPPLVRLILARLASLLSLLSSRVAGSAALGLKEQFYATVMLLSFVRSEANIPESATDRALWSAGLRAGLDAGVEELRKEVIKLRSET